MNVFRKPLVWKFRSTKRQQEKGWRPQGRNGQSIWNRYGRNVRTMQNSEIRYGWGKNIRLLPRESRKRRLDRKRNRQRTVSVLILPGGARQGLLPSAYRLYCKQCLLLQRRNLYQNLRRKKEVPGLLLPMRQSLRRKRNQNQGQSQSLFLQILQRIQA